MGEAKNRKEAGTYPTDESSRIIRVIMEERYHKFIEHFGREPYPEDPVWFDAAFTHPVPLDAEVVTRLVQERFMELVKDVKLVVGSGE
jgi:hypothetical protein